MLSQRASEVGATNYPQKGPSLARQTPSDVVVVLGLGRFGKSLALELMNQGTEVLGLDASESVVQKLAHRLTHAAVVDTTDEESLRQLSVDEYDRAVVGIGSDLEASLLTASALINLNVPPNIWAKAISHSHAKILTQIGVHHVVRPEHDMGKRVAHVVRGRMIDYIEFDDEFAMVKPSPAILHSRPPARRNHHPFEVRCHRGRNQTPRRRIHLRHRRHHSLPPVTPSSSLERSAMPNDSRNRPEMPVSDRDPDPLRRRPRRRTPRPVRLGGTSANAPDHLR